MPVETNNFDFSISKKEAESLLKHGYSQGIIMANENDILSSQVRSIEELNATEAASYEVWFYENIKDPEQELTLLLALMEF